MEEERRRKGQFVFSSYTFMVIDHYSGCVVLYLEIELFELINHFHITID